MIEQQEVTRAENREFRTFPSGHSPTNHPSIGSHSLMNERTVGISQTRLDPNQRGNRGGSTGDRGS